MTARRALPVALWIAIGVLCALQVARTRFVADLSSFLPAAPTAQQRLLVEQLREGALSRVMLVAIEGADARTRAALSDGLAERLRAGGDFSTVANGATAGLAREKDFLFAHRYVLGPDVTPRRFEVAGLRAAIAETLALLASPAGALVKPLVLRDPTGETVALLEALRPATGPRSVAGAWASPDGQRALLLARTRASGADIDAQARAIDDVHAAFAAARRDAGTAANGARLLLTGPGVFSVRSRALVERDAARFSILGIAIVAALLLAVYRSPIALGLGLVPVLSGALAAIAAVSLGFGMVHGITLGFGTTLIGEAVDYSIYLFVQSGRGERAGDARWIAGFWPTIRLGVLTSIAGFSALLFSGLPGLAQLGLYSITGLAVAALVTRFVLPQLLPARFAVRDLSAAGSMLGSLARFATRGRYLVLLLAVAAAAILVAHRGRVWDPELASLNPVPAADRALDAELRKDLGASDARYMVVVSGADEQGALEAAERAGRALDPLLANATLGGYRSPARLLPSAKTQAARRESLPEAATLRERLRAALAGMPLDPRRLEPFIADVEAARAAPPMTRDALAGTAFEAALDGMLFRDRAGRWSAVLALDPTPGGAALDAAAIRHAIESAHVPDAVFVDLKRELDRLYSGYLQRALAMAGMGLAAIVALLFVALREPARVARVLAPLVAGVLVVAAAHVLAGTRLSLLHLVGLLLVVAVGSNYALFFDRLALHAGESAPRTLASLALANATTVASFGLLALSAIPVLHAIGSTVAPGAFVTLAFAAALARAPR